MTPLASVAMLEKLALLKIALCSAPALSSASSACLRVILSVPSKTLIRVLVSSFPLVMMSPPVTCSRPTQRTDCGTLKLRGEKLFNGGLELLLRIRLLKEVRAFNKRRFHFVGNGIACRVEHTQFRPKLDGLVCKLTSANERFFEMDIGEECVDVLRRT